MKAKSKRRLMERKIVEQLILGTSLNKICRTIAVSKRRVMMIRAKAEEAGYLDGNATLPPYPEALFPETVDGRALRSSATWKELEQYLPWIEERLEGGWHAVTVFEELPIKVPRSSFYRFLTRYKLNEKGQSLRRVVPEIIHLPGEALLVDWGYLWMVEQDGRRKKLWAFIGILGYSRHMVVRLMTTCDQTQTLAAMAAMYDELGGVPLRTTSDNPKVFALKANKYEALIHPVYERFANHYGTIIECLPPSDPQKKGKVERPVPYVRRLLEAYGEDRNDVAAIQAYLDRKVAIANERRHGTTGERPVDRFKNEEKAALKPLPISTYEVEQYYEGLVRSDGHVRFQGKYYSLEEQFIRQPVTVIGNSRQVNIYHQGKLIEVHDRVTCRTKSKSTKRHHLKPWEQACDNEEGLRALARKIGLSVEAFVRRILLDGDGFIDFRRIWGVLSLEKKYSGDEINAACDQALECGDLSYRAVVRFITAAQQAAIPLPQEPARPMGKFQRDLTEYSQLLLNLKPTGGIYEH